MPHLRRRNRLRHSPPRPFGFVIDHLWHISLGGPEFDPDNARSAHRACNRTRSNKIDDIAIEAAHRIGGVILTPTGSSETIVHAPDGQHCGECNGVHNPAPGITFTTPRDWWTTVGAWS